MLKTFSGLENNWGLIIQDPFKLFFLRIVAIQMAFFYGKPIQKTRQFETQNLLSEANSTLQKAQN